MHDVFFWIHLYLFYIYDCAEPWNMILFLWALFDGKCIMKTAEETSPFKSALFWLRRSVFCCFCRRKNCGRGPVLYRRSLRAGRHPAVSAEGSAHMRLWRERVMGWSVRKAARCENGSGCRQVFLRFLRKRFIFWWGTFVPLFPWMLGQFLFHIFFVSFTGTFLLLSADAGVGKF